MKLRIAYEKKLREEMQRQQTQRQQTQRQQIPFSFVKSEKFLLLPVIGISLFAVIIVNVISKASGCGFAWEPTPQKCISLVKRK